MPIKKDRRCIAAIYFLLDVVVIGFSFYIPYCLHYGRGCALATLPHFNDAVFLFAVWAGALVAFLQLSGLYGTDRSLSIPREFLRVAGCVVLSSVAAGLMIFLLKMTFFSRLVFAQSFALMLFGVSVWRILKRLMIRYRLSRGFYRHNVLIVGAGRCAEALANEIKRHPHLGINVVGFFDEHKNGFVAGYPVLAKQVETLSDILRVHFIDEVYVTIPAERKLVSEVIAQCLGAKVAVRVLADHFDLPFYHLQIDYLGVVPLINYVGARDHGTEIFLKRFFDVLVSFCALMALLPLFGVIAALIKLDSPGPVFYKSVRLGKKARPFHFYKFRSMIYNADQEKEHLRNSSDVKGPIFKIKNDPRVTRFGRFLRRYSLDELPQLFNVLRADMSLVGPRPPTPDEVEKYDTWQRRRLDVRPGITCLWQVRGRSDLSFYKWVRWDLWYIDNWSFGLDLQILLWTIPVVLSKKGAY